MDNSFYLLTQNNHLDFFDVKRLQICTWNINKTNNSFIELGLGIKFKDTTNIDEIVSNNITIAFFSHFLKYIDKTYCMNMNFSNSQTCKFIFNEIAPTPLPIETKTQSPETRGLQIKFNNTDDVFIVPSHNIQINFENTTDDIRLTPLPNNNKLFKINLSNIVEKIKECLPSNGLDCNNFCQKTLYLRFLFSLNTNIMSNTITCVNKKLLCFDIKINRRRNIIEEVNDLINNQQYNFCKINKVICLHVFPEQYEISFIDNPKKNVRTLEIEPFRKYLSYTEVINEQKEDISIIDLSSKDIYTIIQQSDENKVDGYSFYTMLLEEIISIKQLFYTVFLGFLLSFTMYFETFFRQNANFFKKIWPHTLSVFILVFFSSLLLYYWITEFFKWREKNDINNTQDDEIKWYKKDNPLWLIFIYNFIFAIIIWGLWLKIFSPYQE